VKRIRRAAQFALLALALLYAGDYLSARFRLPGNRQTLGSVEVQTLWAIRQKDGRIDYEPGDTETQPCLRSLFPHLGYTPCWYLSGHTHQVIKVGYIPQGPRRRKIPIGGFLSPKVHNSPNSNWFRYVREG
jgi:hypothetical protein